MLNINIDSVDFVIMDIKKRDLPGMLKWYSGAAKYKYAIGLDRPLQLQELEDLYYEAAHGAKEFYAGIRYKKNQDMIGFVKGSVKQEMAGAMWLNSIVIDEKYQNNGYGTIVFKMLIKYFCTLYDVNKIFISVAVQNIDGIRFWYKNGFKTVDSSESIRITNRKDQNMIFMERKL